MKLPVELLEHIFEALQEDGTVESNDWLSLMTCSSTLTERQIARMIERLSQSCSVASLYLTCTALSLPHSCETNASPTLFDAGQNAVST